MNKYVDKVDGILLDLGVSSPQFDDSSRGFSYRYDSPLDMRMNLESALSAKDVVNKYSEEELYRIIKDYGEEKFAKNIARNICKERETKDIETTFELVDIIKKSLPNKVLNKKGHPAKQTFQAIRIEVNNELASINKFLETFDDILNIDGRVVIITFHSLEDRLVKNKFKELSSIKDDLNIPKRPEEIEKARYELLNRKVIIASKQELEVNNRAKSAKVRGVRKIYGKDS
jgi:16S rRNA (cytosine1402-N4)-methyltransferase